MPDKESIAGTSSSSSFETTQSVAGNSALSNLRRTRSVASQLATVRPEHLDVAQPSSLPSLYIDGLRYVLEDWIHKKRRRSLSWILRYGKYVIRLSDDGTAGGRYWPSTAHDNGPDSEPESSNRTSPAPSSSVSVLDMQKWAAKRRPLIVESRADIFKRLLLGWITDANIPLHGVEHTLFRQLLAFLDDEFVVEVLPTSGNTVRRWILQEFEEHTRMLKDEMNKALSKVHTSFDMWTSPNGIAILSVIAYYVDIAGTPQVRLISLEKLSGSHGGENQAILMAKVIRKYGLEKKIGFFTADNADPCDTCVRALLKMFNPRASPTGLEGLEGERRIRCVGHILNLSAKAFLEGDSSDIFDSHIAEKDQKKERELLREWRKRGPIGKLHNLVYWIRRNPQRRELFLSITSGKVDQSIMAELGVWFVDDTLKGLMVKADNDTRWNSVYLMVHRALRLRDIIDVFCKLSLLDPKEEKRVSAEDVLSCEDWVVLAEIIEILQPYLTYTKHFEGRAPRFAEVLPTMYLLKDHLSEMRQRYSSNLIPAPYRAPRITLEEPVLDCIIVAAPTDGREREQQGGLQQDTGVSTWGRYSTMESTTSGEPSSPLYQAEISVQFEDKDLDPEPFELSDDGLHFIQHSIKYAMSKLDKYRNLMERSVVYWAAMILHPGYGIGFLQLRLPNQVDSILRDFRDYFDRHYAQGDDKDREAEEGSSGGRNQQIIESDAERPRCTKPKNFVQKMTLWHPSLNQRMSSQAWRCLEYLCWPVICFAGFSYGSYLIWFNVTNATASIILSGSGYNFKPSMVGLSYLSCCFGAVVGSLVSGRMSDWLTIKLARRNNGVMEAEHRLWPLIVCVVLVPTSLILWGVGAQQRVHWFFLILAMGALAAACAIGLTISINYLIDCYHGLGGNAIVSIILIRNTMSFAISYGITPWVTNMGYQNCFTSAALIGLVTCSAFFVMIKFGKALRCRSARRYAELATEE
ncbi:putative MFS-type transporter [Fusarium oxysporum f. sp. rapae]|uniref:Putative MFS-type transporter n=1 Tax=Fusarium oxysporum f. sp. rapae TaxID=485398 RepID=A0A8J5NG37_FUSOX|nr:putative MFS-type transporter [Fusarium oxysporum f. sp. rapae]